MILLDTNVLSAVMRATPDPVITTWLNTQPQQEIWTTTITIFEIRYGLSCMPTGRKRATLIAAFEAFITQDLANRVAPLDQQAADTAGSLAAARKAAGFNVDFSDTLIAGIAISRRATLATRNTRHFSDLKIPVINPWTS